MEAPRYSITTSNSQPIGNYFNMEHNNQMLALELSSWDTNAMMSDKIIVM